MTPEQAREIDQREFEAECKAIRQRAYALIAMAKPSIAITPAKPATPSFNGGPVGPTAKLYFHDGKLLSLRDWAQHLGMPYQRLANRVRRNWPTELVLSQQNLKGRCRRGVVSNFEASEGTGAGSTAQETPEITFSEKAA